MSKSDPSFEQRGRVQYCSGHSGRSGNANRTLRGCIKNFENFIDLKALLKVLK
jgi:hypothetical protein